MQIFSLNKAKSKILSLGNKNKAIAIVCILLMTASALYAIAPNVHATSYDTPRPTGTFVAASPAVIGLTQQELINILVYPAPSGPTWYAQDLVIKEQGFDNVSCTITAPDGTKSTFMPIDFTLAHININIPGRTEVVGSIEFYYTPTQVGNYSITASFPGQTFDDKVLNNANDTVKYLPSSSTMAATFTVQQDAVLGGLLNGYPWSPLPTGYWTYPISTNNREWSDISGDWLRATYDYHKTDYNPYTMAPTSAHVLWTQQIMPGGVVGGVFGNLGYGNTAGGGGNAAITSIIIDGKLIQNDWAGGTFSCWDLATGKFLYRQTGIITQGQHLQPYYQTDAQAQEGGILGYLWDFTSTPSVWKQFDPITGASLTNYTNAPSGGTISIYMSEGDPIVYLLQYGGWNTTIRSKFAYENIIKWNISSLNSASDVANGALGQAKISNDWRGGVMWNVSIRQPDGEGIGDGRTTVVLWPYVGANVVLATANNDEGFFYAFDMDTGKYLFNATTVIPLSEDSGGPNGPYLAFDGATASWVAYDVKTGKEIWAYQNGQLPWGDLPQSAQATIDGYWYAGSPDGHMYKVNMQTGAVGWTSDWTGASSETIYGTQPLNGGCAAADGQIYANTATVYGLQPKTRFHGLYDINMTTGQFIWNLTIGAITPTAIADGILIGMDGENGIQYAFGKGLTTTIVTAPTTAVPAGIGVLIQGTVLDLSPGQPNTPAISDADMSTWMTYLHGQNATLINNPPVPNGVPVMLSAVDPNGNSVNIGTVTSDSTGHFATTWVPTTIGQYKIYATFAGSGSYWSSYSDTALAISAATTSTTQQPTQASATPDNTMLLYGILVAVVIAIMIGIVALFRKR